jgi:hypothetical protein
MKKIGFASKSQILKALPDMRKKDNPVIKLSSEALTAPLPDGWLSDVRDFLTRKGKWAAHPIISMEHFVSIPAVGVLVDRIPKVIGDFKKPVLASLGFGRMSFNTFECQSNTCKIQGMICPNVKNTCGFNHCTEQNCPDFKCQDNACTENKCTQHDCTTFAARVDFISELEGQLDHPFVQALMKHFRIRKTDKLAHAVQNFVGINGVDASIL